MVVGLVLIAFTSAFFLLTLAHLISARKLPRGLAKSSGLNELFGYNHGGTWMGVVGLTFAPAVLNFGIGIAFWPPIQGWLIAESIGLGVGLVLYSMIVRTGEYEPGT